MSEIQKPSIGRIVIVKRKDGGVISNGQTQAPAIVQTAWSGEPMLINCCVLADCAAPRNSTSIPHESRTHEGYVGETWSWPERIS